MADLWRDFWIRETGTGQQVAQLHDRYMMMMMMMNTMFNMMSVLLLMLHTLPKPTRPCWNPWIWSRFLAISSGYTKVLAQIPAKEPHRREPVPDKYTYSSSSLFCCTVANRNGYNVECSETPDITAREKWTAVRNNLPNYYSVHHETCSNKPSELRSILSIPLTLRRLMSYIYGAPILDVSRSHTTTQHSR